MVVEEDGGQKTEDKGGNHNPLSFVLKQEQKGE